MTTQRAKKKVKHILARNAKIMHAYKHNGLVIFVKIYEHIGHLVFSRYSLKHHCFPEKNAYKHIVHAFCPPLLRTVVFRTFGTFVAGLIPRQ
jgi:hypothetical protein